MDGYSGMICGDEASRMKKLMIESDGILFLELGALQDRHPSRTMADYVR